MAKNQIIIIVTLLLGLGVLGVVLFTSQSSPKDTGKDKVTLSTDTNTISNPMPDPTSTSTPVASAALKPNTSYEAILKTSAGNMTISLNSAATPVTAANFVTLARKGFYNNTIFHRVIKGFMIQGGDPQGTGMGGPGYTFADEPFTGEYTKGTVAMANAGPNTNGSQFFIMHANYPLPKNYVIFGKVTTGIETVDKIATAPVTESDSGEPSKPVTPVKVLSVEIIEQPASGSATPSSN